MSFISLLGTFSTSVVKPAKRGTVAFTESVKVVDVTIAPIDMAKSYVQVDGWNIREQWDSATSYGKYSKSVMGEIISSTVIRFTAEFGIGSASGGTCKWQLKEYN